jgi:membrane-bound inhibitor of C-type lysozyme
MKSLAILSASMAVACIAAPVMAATMQPPMDSFSDAFYTCDNHGAFQVSYDAPKPTMVTMTTSNDNTQYHLKRTLVAKGVEFTSGGVDFWTDGKTVVVKGTKIPLQNCQFKPST